MSLHRLLIDCHCGYKLTDCDGVKSPIYTLDDLSAYVGNVIGVDGEGETCWQVDEHNTCGEQTESVTVSTATPAGGWSDCQACEDDGGGDGGLPSFCEVDCPYPDMNSGPSRLRLRNYSPGDLVVQDADGQDCTQCTDSTDAEWDGTFPERKQACTWRTDPNSDLPQNIQIDGKKAARIEVVLGSDGSGPSGTYFLIRIGCENSPSNEHIWYGAKCDNPDTVEGTYYRIDGCDQTASFYLESY